MLKIAVVDTPSYHKKRFSRLQLWINFLNTRRDVQDCFCGYFFSLLQEVLKIAVVDALFHNFKAG